MARRSRHLPPLRPRYPFFQELLLTINAILFIPMYTQLAVVLLFWAMFYYAQTLWIRTVLLGYQIYIIFLDRTPTEGQYKLKSVRRALRSLPFFKWFALYFDMELIKTADLESSQPHIFLYHPHGIIGMGANLALNTNGCGFETIFPGMERSAVTLNQVFWLPLFRDWILWGGFISANRRTLQQRLQEESIVLVPGGAAEALHAHPGVMKLYLKHRKGFIRLALETKCPLVPCVGFGENEIFDSLYEQADSNAPQADNSKLLQVQQRLAKILKFSTPILMHLIPRRCKVTVVVGEPLVMGEDAQGEWDDAVVDKYHKLYLERVRQLYDSHKKKYGYDQVDIEFV